MKIIKREEVIERVIGGKEVYMLIPIGPTTMIEELAEAKGFCVAEVETEKKRKHRKNRRTKPRRRRNWTTVRSAHSGKPDGVLKTLPKRLAAAVRRFGIIWTRKGLSDD